MFPTFKKWFVPHQGNDYRPHIVRTFSVAALIFLVGFLFIASRTVEELLVSQDSFLAAVVSSVLVDLTNMNRAEEGLNSLVTNATLTDAARRKAEDMASRGYFAHNSPDGKTPWFWFGEAGYSFSYAGENLAVFFGDSADVQRAWMNSPLHRANILNSHFTEVGIATAEGVYQGQKTVFVVQMFGTPAVAAPIAFLESQIPETDRNTSVGVVSGESAVVISEENTELKESVSVIHEDDTFIAIRNDARQEAPSTGLQGAQSTFFERLIASPHTALEYVYGTLAVVLAFALVLLVGIEFRIQRPRSIVLGLLMLTLLGALFFFSGNDVVLAEGGSLSKVFLLSV